MAKLVCAGAALNCSMGSTPATLIVPPLRQALAQKYAANIMDNKPVANIPSFGVCNSLLNPAVAAATASALGVLTPMPCVPNIPAPWTPGSLTFQINAQPALNSTSQCLCAWGGTVSITNPGQTTIDVA